MTRPYGCSKLFALALATLFVTFAPSAGSVGVPQVDDVTLLAEGNREAVDCWNDVSTPAPLLCVKVKSITTSGCGGVFGRKCGWGFSIYAEGFGAIAGHATTVDNRGAPCTNRDHRTNGFEWDAGGAASCEGTAPVVFGSRGECRSHWSSVSATGNPVGSARATTASFSTCI